MSWTNMVEEQSAKNQNVAQKNNAPNKKAGTEKRLAAAIDFAYTLNHALVCTATDPITDVPIGVFVENALTKRRNSKAGLEVEKERSLNELKPSELVNSLKDNFKGKEKFVSWFAGEVAGDFGAVPAVVALRHFAPGAVAALGKVVNPIAEPFFKKSTSRAARKEFAAQGLDVNSEECKARAKQMLEAELEHLPNAALWTILSPTINIATQRLALPKKYRSEGHVTDLVIGKAIGSTVTSSLTVGLRNISPDSAQKWDDTVTEKVAMPVVNLVSKVFGVDKDELKAGVEEMHRRKEGKNPTKARATSAWETRLTQEAKQSDYNLAR